MGNSIENKTLNKENLLKIMTDNLPALRAKLGLSQDEVSNLIGISRQTYCAIETQKRKMSWNNFISLLFLFWYNEKTKVLVSAIDVFPEELQTTLSCGNQGNPVSK
ncbi:MAG: helix-turn-helix domain-containing protein [Oscillospiraceae bacterium]|nr:helix-turn-helix domain-containing protein [Oscillospiraceae bacterium]